MLVILSKAHVLVLSCFDYYVIKLFELLQNESRDIWPTSDHSTLHVHAVSACDRCECSQKKSFCSFLQLTAGSGLWACLSLGGVDVSNTTGIGDREWLCKRRGLELWSHISRTSEVCCEKIIARTH